MKGGEIMLIYDGPIGKSIKNPMEDFLKEILLKDETYWYGSGDSSLYFEDSIVNRLISLKMNPMVFSDISS